MEWIQGVGAIPGGIEYGSGSFLFALYALIASVPLWVALNSRPAALVEEAAVEVAPETAAVLDEPQRRAA